MGRAVQHRGRPDLEDLLHQPAVVLLQGHLVGLGGVDPDVVGVVLVPLPVTDALQEDLDEAEASVGRDRRGSGSDNRACWEGAPKHGGSRQRSTMGQWPPKS